VLTRPKPDVPWKGPTGRLTPQMVLELVPDYRKRTIFACGPTPFMEHAREVMAGLGYPMQRFFMESFGGSKEKQAGGKRPASAGMADLLPTPIAVPKLAPGSRAGPKGAPAPAPALDKVVFARSGREVVHDGEAPLLDLAERLGVSIPSAYRAGVCGTCKVKLTQGKVEMECSDGLSDQDRAQGRVLSCTARPRGAVVVDA
jgi:glycine betaine catabolism B